VKRTTPAPVKPPREPRKRRLSPKERGELESLPDRIDAAERAREAAYAALSDPPLLRDGAAVADARAKLASLEMEIGALTARWEELETIAAES
jgi:ATP-binding cassette subfamily F protein uup